MFIKNFFRKQSRFEKCLFETSIYDSQETVDLEDIKQMLHGFPCLTDVEQINSQIQGGSILREFIQLIPKTLETHKKMKVLLTIHVLMGDVHHGIIFVQYMNSFTGFKDNKDDIMGKFIGIHTMILQKLATICDITTRSKLKTNVDILFKDIDESVMQFYKVINCLNFILAQYDLFLSVAKLQNRTVVMEIYLLLWNDVIALYLMLERFVRQFLECYTQLDQKAALQIFELFNEYIKLTNSVKQFGQISKIFKNCSISIPKWFNPSKKEIDELTIYFQNVRIYLTSRSKRQKNDKSSSQVYRAYQSTDRQQRKYHSQLVNKNDSYLLNTTFGYMKKISTVSPNFLQQTFESEQNKSEQQQLQK